MNTFPRICRSPVILFIDRRLCCCRPILGTIYLRPGSNDQGTTAQRTSHLNECRRDYGLGLGTYLSIWEDAARSNERRRTDRIMIHHQRGLSNNLSLLDTQPLSPHLCLLSKINIRNHWPQLKFTHNFVSPQR